MAKADQYKYADKTFHSFHPKVLLDLTIDLLHPRVCRIQLVTDRSRFVAFFLILEEAWKNQEAS